jgi:anti-sigma factor RsiW
VNDEDELACREVVELLTAYLDGALSAQVRSSVESHLAECPPCDIFLDQLRSTIRLAGRLPPEEIHPDTAQVLLEKFRSWRPGTP